MRAYLFLVRLFPASFRLEYGREMAAVFARRRRECPGPPALLWLWLETLGDVSANAARVHLDLSRQDLRYTAHTLRRAPGFTATAILVAALGVGATTATFSITDHVLIRPLPYADASRLVMLWEDPWPPGSLRNEVSPANYRDWKGMSTSFEAMGAYGNRTVNLVGEGDPEQLNASAFTADVLPTLGRAPLLGRSFTEADARQGAPGTVLLSYALWTTRFGADSGVLGRTVRLDDEPHTVIGVMPPGFHFPSRETQVWTAFRLGEEDFQDRTNTYIYVIARRRGEVTLEQARAEMRLVSARLEQSYPKRDAKVSATVVPLREHLSGQARMLLRTLFGAALCVLLIASTNLASLLIARGAFRRKELAVRTALGAGRERLVRQLLTESLVLAACGGALGVLLATAAIPLITRLVPNALPIAAVPALDLRLLGFATLVTALTGVGFGVVPALRASNDPGAGGLREGTRAGSRSERLRASLVIAEITASVVLLASAGLLIRALWRVQHVDPGFRAEGVLTLRTALPMPKYETERARHDYYGRVLDDVRALPGVANAAFITGLPMLMRGGIWSVEVPGHPVELGPASAVSLRFTTPGFFDTLGIPLRSGRDVQPSDTRESPFVAVVSESFASRHWPGEDPLDRRFRMAEQEWTVVGVVGDVRVRGLEADSEPQVYLPYRQVQDRALVGYTPKDLVVRSPLDEAALVPALRRIVARADPQQPISGIRRLTEVVADDAAPRSVQVRVLAGFAAVAILLAGIGIHGLLAFTVSQRQQEFGVRMVLGARPADILQLVLRQGVMVAVAGVTAGLTLAYGAGCTLQALLFGVSAFDPATFVATLAMALLMTLAGSLWPAIRASRVDPLAVMRAE